MINVGSYFGLGGFAWLVFPLMIWSLLWKGLALWHAGRRADEKWFIGLLLINSIGILEIVYLFAILKLKTGDLFKK
jgi:methionyl-tRNA synthetase